MKIGLFFGSFNPVHIGHMIIAQYVLNYSDLQEIWFVVSPHNPLKEKQTLLDDRQRLHMVNLAIGNQPNMRTTDIEFCLPQPSYTINTLAHLQEKYPTKTFALIMGEDNLATLHKWKNHERIVDMCALYVYPRPNSKNGTYTNHPKVHRIAAPMIELSSTAIRAAINQNKDVSFMLPQDVWQYIVACGFYRT
jgi:nicotinate-nucleotide adenylyltransferase